MSESKRLNEMLIEHEELEEKFQALESHVDWLQSLLPVEKDDRLKTLISEFISIKSPEGSSYCPIIGKCEEIIEHLVNNHGVGFEE